MHKLLCCIFFLLCVVVPAQAKVIALYGFSSNADIAAFLNANGHTVTDYGGAPPTVAQLAGVDVVIALRLPGNADITNFVSGGGLLITEWSASDWALNTAHLLNATDSGSRGNHLDSWNTLTTDGVALGLDAGISNPYQDDERTDFLRNLNSFGAGVTVLATTPMNGAVDFPSMIIGGSGSGCVLVNGHDWGDSFPAAGGVPTATWLLNALKISPATCAVPPPPPPPPVATPVPTNNSLSLLLMLAGVAAIGMMFKKRMGTK